jgi:hypothetical protein
MLFRVPESIQSNFSNPRKDSNQCNEIPAIVKLIIQTGKDKSSKSSNFLRNKSNKTNT